MPSSHCAHHSFRHAAYEAVHGASSCFVAGKPPDCLRPDGDELQAMDRSRVVLGWY